MTYILNTPIFALLVPEGEKTEKGTENIFEETIAGNFPNMGKKTFPQVQEVQRVPGRINPRKSKQRHIEIK